MLSIPVAVLLGEGKLVWFISACKSIAIGLVPSQATIVDTPGALSELKNSSLGFNTSISTNYDMIGTGETADGSLSMVVGFGF